MTVMVTGGMGFLGQAVVEQLLLAGETVVDYNRALTEPSPISDRHVYAFGELHDLSQLLVAIQASRVDRVIHTAAVSHPTFSIGAPWHTVFANALGTATVLEAARLAGVQRFVNLSSECAYGCNAGSVPEESLTRPTSPYGATKVFTEDLSRVYRDLYAVGAVSLRVGWIYGPRQVMQCYMKTLLRNAIDGQPTVEPVGRDQKFQYVYVKDVARACILAANHAHPKFDIYNITGGIQVTFEEMAEIVRELFPSAQIQLGPGTCGLDDQGLFDLRRAKEDLGYFPSSSLKDNMSQYADWLKIHAE